jgi:hypothetical protein
MARILRFWNGRPKPYDQTRLPQRPDQRHEEDED